MHVFVESPHASLLPEGEATLEDVLRHYAQFFAIVTDPSIDGDPLLILKE